MAAETTGSMSSVLGQSAVVIGNVRGTGDLEIRGKVQGSVEVTGRIFVAETGVVLGAIEATQIKVAGEVRGNLQADDGVVVASSAQVEGDIHAPRVSIEAGARIRGMLRTGGEFATNTESKAKAPQVQAPAIVQPPPVQFPPVQSPPVAQSTTSQAALAQSAPLAPSVTRGSDHDTADMSPRSDSAPTPHRARKRKRPRPRVEGSTAQPSGDAEARAIQATHKVHVDSGTPIELVATEKKPERPRGPKGPPKVPTFEKGAKGRART